jgi:Cu2+-exporting ATPase
VASINPVGISEQQLLQLFANAEAGSQHPLAKGLVEHASQKGLVPNTAPESKTIPGRGIATCGTDGTILAGSRLLLEEAGIELDETMQNSSNSCVHLAQNGIYRGWAELSDTTRPDAANLISGLTRSGYQTLLLTGDRKGVAEALTKQLAINHYYAELTPADKARLLEEQPLKPVMMVGDGINDAPALTTAQIGCTLAGSTDIAVESADLILSRARLINILTALRLANGSMRIIRQNLFWAFSYNIVALPLAASGHLAPVYGAAAMAVSSICVVTNSLRLKRIKLGNA